MAAATSSNADAAAANVALLAAAKLLVLELKEMCSSNSHHEGPALSLLALITAANKRTRLSCRLQLPSSSLFAALQR